MNLVDSSILIRFLRRTLPLELHHRLSELISTNVAATNRSIVAELLVGARSSAEFDTLNGWLNTFDDFQVTERTWWEAARLGYDLRRAGLTIGQPDLLIATSAIEHDATLVHADADFDRIAAHSDLKVESYVGAV